jgi:hypothetical protein
MSRWGWWGNGPRGNVEPLLDNKLNNAKALSSEAESVRADETASPVG